MQLTERFHTNGEFSTVTAIKNHFLRKSKLIAINPNTNEMVPGTLPKLYYPNDTVIIIEPHSKFDNQTGLCVTSAIVKLRANEDVSLAVLNVLPLKITIPKNTIIARITISTPKQAEYLQPNIPQLLSDYFNQNINALV